jgi:siderophore synthetase component
MLGEPEPFEPDPHSRALLSALLREVDGWVEIAEGGRRRLELALPLQAVTLEVPLQRAVGVGRISSGQPRLRDASGARPLRTPELIAVIVGEPALARALGVTDAVAAERLIARVRASAANLEATLDRRAADLEALCERPLGFIAAEQGLLLGHSVHPAPRLREGLGADDDRLVPELGGRTPLQPWAVARERLVAGGEQALARLDTLLAGDPAWREQAALAGDLVVLPLHPLQHRALLEHPNLASARRRGELRPLGPCGRAWAVTSSLRTLHADGAPYMLKFSLPVRLTNSRRTLSLAELERGLVLGRLLAQPGLAALAERHPNFHLLREPAYFGLRADDGAPGPKDSFFALRDNPFTADQPVEMLATLLQDHPRTGRSRLALRIERAAERTGARPLALVERWFAAYLEVALAPIVTAQAEHGLLLSAHQQNLAIGLAADGLTPSAAWFRDAQGTAYTELALRRHGEQVPGLAQAVFGAPLGERVWAYSVVINGVFNVIASLAMVPGVAQSWLLAQLRACLLELRAREPADPRALEYLLNSPKLWTKANVRCFAGGVDEVALADPLAIYTPMANPLLAATAPLVVRGGQVENFATDAVVEPGQLRIGEHARPFTVDGERIAWAGASETETNLLADHLFSLQPELRHLVLGDITLVRESFYQKPGPWHHRGEAQLPDGGLEVTGRIVHPRRPRESAALLYRRHCPAIGQTFSLHRFEPARDLDLFCAWMNDPVVAHFWEQAWPRARLSEYIEQRLADPHVIPAIGRFDGRPFAYYEIYWAKEDRLGPHYAADDFDRGFHMAVGDAEVRHRGWGRQWFLALAHYLFLDDARTQRLVGEPRIDQARVRSWSASTPWEEWGEVQFPHKRAVLMVLTRERFFAEFEGR